MPYALVGVIAVKKRYPWLAAGAFYLVVVAVFVTFAETTPQYRALLGSITSLFLLRHALDIPTRK